MAQPSPPAASAPPVYDPLAPAADPYPAFGALRRDFPVCYLPAHDVWLVSRFDDAQRVLRDWSTFTHRYGVDFDGTDRRLFGDGDFLEAEPPQHTALRGIVKAWFTPKAISSLEDRTRGLCNTLALEFRERGGGDAVTDFARPIPFVIGMQLLGLPA